MNVEPFILTQSGRRIYVREPALNAEIHLEDIAFALARISRFGGHAAHAYSVASHSLMVADLVSPGFRRDALMHDAIEAILGDVVSPLKSCLPQYVELEHAWMRTMSARWGVHYGGLAVRDADAEALAVEFRDLFPPTADVDTSLAPLGVTVAKYRGRPASVGAWWLAEARRLGVKEIA